MRSPAIDLVYTTLLDAWNRRDAAAFAALFGDTGTMIGFDGSTATGGDAIRGPLAPLFRHHPTARYVYEVEEIRQLGETFWMLRAVVGMVPPGGDTVTPDVNALQTLVAHHLDGRWTVTLFQNTPAQYHGRPDLVEEHTRRLTAVLEATRRPSE